MNVRLEKSSQKMDIKSLRQDSGLASPRPHIIKVSEKKLATQTKQQMALSAWKGTSLLFSLGVKSHPGAKNAARFLPAKYTESQHHLFFFKASFKGPNLSLSLTTLLKYYSQEAMESFAFPDKINSINTDIWRKCSKLFFFSLESFEYSLYILDWYSKGKA